MLQLLPAVVLSGRRMAATEWTWCSNTPPLARDNIMELCSSRVILIFHQLGGAAESSPYLNLVWWTSRLEGGARDGAVRRRTTLL